MSRVMNGLKRFVKEEDAPTMVEYGLLVALIAIIVAAAALLLGQGVSTLFSNTEGSLS